MKRIKGTLCKLLACTALLAISAFALLAFLPAKTETAFAEETKTYRITIDSNANSFRRAIVSRLPAADKATTIYFEYSFVSASTGKPGAFGPGSTSGIIDGGEYTEVIKGHACPMHVVSEDFFLKKFCKQDGKYVASFKIADIETALAAGESVSYDSMSLVFNANDGTTSRLDDGWGGEAITSTRYCGLFYGSGNWRATLDVRCYDDTGKDLQITTYGYAKIENMLELPEDESTLTTFSQSDSYFFSGSVERMNFGGWGTYGRNALNESENYYLDATSEKLNGKGAEGTVAVMKKSATGGNADKAQVSIGFGRTLTKEQVDLGGSLLVRLAGEYVDDWAGYSNMFPLDCNDDPSKAVSNDIGGLTLLRYGFFKNSLENGFTDFIIPNEELKKLCNEDGSFSGFQFLWNRFTDRGSGDWTLYLDKVSYVFNVTLENNGGTGETKTTIGAINGKLTAPAAPEKVGSKFTGWYSDAACENLYDFNGTVTGDITLYAGWDDYKIENFSVSVAGDIGLNFYAKLPEAETYTARFATGEKSVGSSVGTYDESIGLWKFTCSVAPKDYKEKITATIDLGSDGVVAGTAGVEDYAKAVGETEAVKPLVNAMLDYCEAARAYFAGEDAETETEFAADLTEYAATVSGTQAGVNLLGATLVLESKSEIKIYFAAENISGINFIADGISVTPESAKEDGDVYVITLSDIVAKDLGTAHVIKIGDITVTYSAMSYVKATLEGENKVVLNNLVKALYNYRAAAVEYFK